MAAPTFVTSVNTSTWAQAFGSALTMSLTTQVGDLIVVIGTLKSHIDGLVVSDSATNTYTQRADVAVDSSHAELYIWTATASTAASVTISVSRGAGTEGDDGIVFGATAYQFRSAGGVGAVVSGSGTGTAPSVNLTTTGANSAAVMFIGDRAATALTSQTYRSNAGTFTQRTAAVAQNNDTLANEYCVYHGYHADSGATGTYAIGMTAPASQTWTLAAIEVLGSGSSQSQAPRSMHQFRLRSAQ
jgi:hypothetical protein